MSTQPKDSPSSAKNDKSLRISNDHGVKLDELCVYHRRLLHTQVELLIDNAFEEMIAEQLEAES